MATEAAAREEYESRVTLVRARTDLHVSGSSGAGVRLIWSLLVIVLSLLLTPKLARAEEPPVIPVGLDAYTMWDRWPYQRIGARAYMWSTYDRTGGNRGPDASHFLYQRADDFNVTLDVEGTGVLYFARYNHWHGS